MMTQEEEVPPRDVRFQTQTKSKGAGAGGANTLCSSFFLDSAKKREARFLRRDHGSPWTHIPSPGVMAHEGF